jgi:hypothetical protein
LPNPPENPPPLFRAQQSLSAGRPWPLTLLCVVGAVLLCWSCWHASGGSAARAFGRGYWLYFSATTGALGFALWGLWKLRRWALWVFPLGLLLDDVVVGLMGELRPGVVVLQAALILLVLSQLRAFGQK